MGKSKNNTDYDYEQLKIMHKEGGKCEVNYLKSSDVLQSAGAVEIFRYCIEKYGLAYNQYLIIFCRCK